MRSQERKPLNQPANETAAKVAKSTPNGLAVNKGGGARSLTRARATAALLITAFIALSLWLILLPVDFWQTYFGHHNTYFLMFLVAFLGSISTFASIPYPLVLIGFVSAGLNPLLLALTAAAGISLADTVTFNVARSGRAFLSAKFVAFCAKLNERVARHPSLLSGGLVLYGAFSPLSNDFAVIATALARLRFWRVIIPLGLGNIIFCLNFAFFGPTLQAWLASWF